jgi:hypothetical protein
MPEPSNDSVSVTAGVTTGNGAKAEPARMNMELRGPMRSSSDQLNDNLGGFDPPKAQLTGLPFGQAQKADPTGESKG